MPSLPFVLATALCLGVCASAAAQEGAQAGDPMRIVIMVDNSQTFLDDTPQIRRALQQFVNALPPSHELMLVTTGGQMNIRVRPTRDYLEILEAATEITRMRSAGNAMVGSVQEIYERYLRTAERRYPMIVILTGDGNDTSQRITDKGVNELLNGLRKTGVLVNAVMLTSSGVGLVRSIVLEMVKRTGGAHESVVVATALSGRMKVMAGRVAQQYKQVSPDRAPTEEFKRSAPPR
jgi:hypothetical protein